MHDTAVPASADRSSRGPVHLDHAVDIRTRIAGVDCRFACDLPEADMAGLVEALGRPRPAGAALAVLGGRSRVFRYDLPSVGPVVIKEFRRGGLLRMIRRRHYLRMGTTRPDREFDALRVARAAGVNVPEVIASFVRGGLFYRGWLATRLVEGRALILTSATTPEIMPEVIRKLTWQIILLIRHRISHVDLHPGNVMVDAHNVPVLVDFDRAVMFKGSPEALRDHYHVRWTRAVEKHHLLPELGALFTDGLIGRPSCSLTCDRPECLACPQPVVRPGMR